MEELQEATARLEAEIAALEEAIRQTERYLRMNEIGRASCRERV